jgi:hypothetical protein
MSSASWALQQAVYATLIASSEVQAVVGTRVYDMVPREAVFPYLVVGDDDESNADTKTEQGSEHALTVTAWSRAGGREEVKLAAEAVRSALDGAALALSGHVLIDIRYLSAQFLRESDGQTFRAVIKFRAVTEPS